MGQGMYGRKRKSLPLRASEGALQPRYQVPAQKGKWDWAWLEEVPPLANVRVLLDVRLTRAKIKI